MKLLSFTPAGYLSTPYPHAPPPFLYCRAQTEKPSLETQLTISNITDPRALALVLEQAEAKLAKEQHPDPYRREYTDSPASSRLTGSASLPRRHQVVRMRSTCR